MKFLLMTNHSQANKALADITAKNTWNYSARNDYDLTTLRMTWEESKVGFLDAVNRALCQLVQYDGILTFGSDVLFMNHASRIEDIIQPNDNVVMAMEKSGYDGCSPINNDVVVWMRTEPTIKFIQALIAASGDWLAKKHLWQDWLVERYNQGANTAEGLPIRFTEPRNLSASLQATDFGWRPGDFALHLLGLPHSMKCAMARNYLPLVMVD